MGCFLACFGSSKNKKRQILSNRVQLEPQQRNESNEPLRLTEAFKQEIIIEKTVCPVSESRDEVEEQLSLNTRKKVTFDLNVKAYDKVSSQETNTSLSDDGEETGKTKDEIVKPTRSTSPSEDNSSSSSLGSFPSNHRYGNCINSDDDEYEEMESVESEFDNEDEEDYEDDYHNDGKQLGEVESSESLFSLPVGSRTGSTPLSEKEVTSPLKTNDSPKEEKKKHESSRDRSQYVHSVLNPVENLTQWKAVKAKTPSPLMHQKKENINLETKPDLFTFSAEPTFKQSSFGLNPKIDQSFSFESNFDQSSPSKQEIALDASLSTWLGSSDSTPSIKSGNRSIGTGSVEVNKLSPRSHSPRSQEDRPILGALTLEEIRQFSATSSPRKSPTRSPDEMPILGTVGSYWSHTNQTTDSSSDSSIKGIPNTTSKYREDKRVNWHSTPFETRLERALKKGAAEAYSS